MIKINQFIFKFIPKGVVGITLYPFIFLINEKYLNNDKLINHEKIHLKQQREMLIIFFYIAYIINLIINLIIYRKYNEAYRNICFEREAYKNQNKINYLSTRKLFSFIKYI